MKYINISKITAELSGPCHEERIGKKVEDQVDKSWITQKYQKCGKKCKTCMEGRGHGPYFWRVTYLGIDGHGKKKYRWKFIGKKL